MVLVELCAGSAAVSLRALGQKTPLRWLGGKQGYADQILQAMFLAPGDGQVEEVVLAEPGPWADAWELWRAEGGLETTIEWLTAWQGIDPRELWETLVASHPGELTHRVAAWAVLMYWGWGAKPVRAVGEKWKGHSFDHAGVYRRDIANAKRAQGLKYDTAPNMTLDRLAAKLQALDLQRLHPTIYRDAFDVPVIPGAVAYIDPPYQGTTCAYGHELPRERVVELAERWAAGGAIVYVSEAEPLPIPGWRHGALDRPRGRGRTFSRQQAEWLTVSAPDRCPDGFLYPEIV